LSTSRKLVKEWPLASTATLGSALRAKGVERELRRRLPWSMKKFLTVEAGNAILGMPDADGEDFEAASATIAQALFSIADLPVLPSEAEDILSISSRERHKWMNDGRLKSAGTRTVKLRGARQGGHLPRLRAQSHRASSRQWSDRGLARRGR
jgi:hypothetical protein